METIFFLTEQCQDYNFHYLFLNKKLVEYEEIQYLKWEEDCIGKK